jgi:peptide/nickel transport system permease protein
VAGYVGGRIAQGSLVVLGAVAISFLLVNLTGNAVDALGTGVDPETRERLIAEYGFDRPFHERFADYVAGVLQADFGQSFRAPTPALERVLDALPYTATLVALTSALACAVAIPVALHSVLRRGTLLDVGVRRAFMLAQGLPEFFVGLVLILVFAVVLGWLPSFGVDGPRAYVMPVVALALPLLSTLTRLLRSQLLDVLGMEFVTALRAKGLTRREIVLRHAFPNALPPLITYLALQLGWLLGGTVIVEVVFGIPGIGLLAVTATESRDLSVIQAIVVTVAVGYVALNLLADLAVYALDPRVRAAR